MQVVGDSIALLRNNIEAMIDMLNYFIVSNSSNRADKDLQSLRS